MKEYRAVILIFDHDVGAIRNRVDLICANEDEAKLRAREMVAGNPVELWEGNRRIARFNPEVSN